MSTATMTHALALPAVINNFHYNTDFGILSSNKWLPGTGTITAERENASLLTSQPKHCGLVCIVVINTCLFSWRHLNKLDDDNSFNNGFSC